MKLLLILLASLKVPVSVSMDNYVNEIDVNKLARCFYSAQRSADRNTETGSSAVSVSQVESKIYVSGGFCISVYNEKMKRNQ